MALAGMLRTAAVVRDREDRNHQEDGALREHISDRAGHDGNRNVAAMIEGGVAAETPGETDLGVTPRVNAATAGAKASPAIARTPKATAIGQNVGRPKMMSEAKRHRRDRYNDDAPLRRGQVDRGADRGLERNAEKPACRRDKADLGLAPMPIRHEIDVDKGPEQRCGRRPQRN